MRLQYRKKRQAIITAVRIDLETEGFLYEKWGGIQKCKAGDWIVNNDDDVYTIDREVFERTYEQVSPGRYIKTSIIFAEVAGDDGKVKTKEGITHYQAGDFIVYNDSETSDCYAVGREKFLQMYELVE